MAFAFLALSVLVYWGGMAAIIRFDAKLQRDKARAAGTVDFMDRSLTPYMVLGVICGPLPLIFYFGTTRKTFLGWLMGFAIGAGWTILASILINVAAAIANHV